MSAGGDLNRDHTWGQVTIYRVSTCAAISPNQLHQIRTQVQKEDRNVNPQLTEIGWK